MVPTADIQRREFGVGSGHPQVRDPARGHRRRGRRLRPAAQLARLGDIGQRRSQDLGGDAVGIAPSLVRLSPVAVFDPVASADGPGAAHAAAHASRRSQKDDPARQEDQHAPPSRFHHVAGQFLQR